MGGYPESPYLRVSGVKEDTGVGDDVTERYRSEGLRLCSYSTVSDEFWAVLSIWVSFRLRAETRCPTVPVRSIFSEEGIP